MPIKLSQMMPSARRRTFVSSPMALTAAQNMPLLFTGESRFKVLKMQARIITAGIANDSASGLDARIGIPGANTTDGAEQRAFKNVFRSITHNGTAARVANDTINLLDLNTTRNIIPKNSPVIWFSAAQANAATILVEIEGEFLDDIRSYTKVDDN